MQSFTIDAKHFLAGESNWDYISDRGFSPDSHDLNLLLKPGVLNFGWTTTDIGGATLTGSVVASCDDLNVLTGQKLFVDDAGAFYTLTGTTFTKRQTSTNSNGWQLGTTDMVEFLGNVYATYNGLTTGMMAQLTGTNMTGITSDFWTGMTVGVRHPLEVVEGKMYIGDANFIHYFDGSTSSGSSPITLPTDSNITSLRKHPDGRHLIAFTAYVKDFSHQGAPLGRIYIINKDTLTWEREISIDAQVEGSRLEGGIVYTTYGKRLGYFTGSGIKFLKQLKTSGTTYSHSLSNMENFLLMRDGTNVLLLGDLGNGSSGWHNIYQTSTINVVSYQGQNKILVGTSSATLVQLDYATPTVSGLFVSNRYNFDSVVKVRRMDIIHDKKTAGATLLFNLFIRDTDDATNLLQQSPPTESSPSKTRIELNVDADVFQFELAPSQGILGIKLIRIYYEPVV